MCRSMATVPGILGLVWLRFRPNSNSKSKISVRILQRFWGSSSFPAGWGREAWALQMRLLQWNVESCLEL